MISLQDTQLQEIQQYLEDKGVEVGPFIQVVVKYHGDIEAIAREVGASAQILNENFAALRIAPNNIERLTQYTEIEYVESDKVYAYTIAESMKAACITQVQVSPTYQLTGKGVLLGIVDSGISYWHPDFRNEDGTTRIAYLWDQSIAGNPPLGFEEGTEYTKEQINEALSKPTRMEQLSVVPSQDTIGHGTHVAGIAGGNGRGSRGKYVGAAPEAEFIIVKLGKGGNVPLVRSIEIMTGIKYVIEKAQEMGRPIAVNLSLGMNEGSHDGATLMELYLNDMSQRWKNNIVVGSGNEGNARIHAQGTLEMGQVEEILLQIGESKKSYNFSVWQSSIDTFNYEIIAPNGMRTPRLSYPQGARQYLVSGTKIYTSFSGPSPLNGAIEFGVYLTGQGGRDLPSGVWTIRIYGVDIVEGNYNLWGQTSEIAGQGTFILNEVPETTVTTPGTSRGVITVGAYNHISNQLAVFSGRGFARNNIFVKPDLVAPGVNIVSASNTGGYKTLSGTSMATPHVTGGVALLMQWGIVEARNIFLYAENLKAFLLKGAIRDITGVIYPDVRWGYGKLCIKNTLDILVRERIL